MADFKFALGDKVKDTITDFEGTIISRTEWLNNCVRYMVQPRKLSPDGKVVSPECFDEMSLTLVEAADPPVKPVKTGGPRLSPKMVGR